MIRRISGHWSKWGLLAIVTLLALTPAIHAEPILAMPAILNDLALDVYAETIHLMIINTFGLTLDPLSYSGTFTETGWTVTTTGVYRGMAVNLSGTGIFDNVSNTGTLVSTGTVGNAEWDGSGSWAFTGPDPLSLALVWAIQAIVQTSPISGPDVTVDKEYKFKSVNPRRLLYTDEGTQQMSRNGKAFGPKLAETSAGSYDFDLGKSTHFTTGGFVSGTSENKIPEGTRTGTTKGTPEPGTLMLLGIGIVTLCLLRKRTC